MLLLLTLFAAWLGWELSFIRERQAWLRENATLVEGIPTPPPAPKSPLYPWRHWLGDNEVTLIWDRGTWGDAERAGVVRLFPEANLEEPTNSYGVNWVMQPSRNNPTPSGSITTSPRSAQDPPEARAP